MTLKIDQLLKQRYRIISLLAQGGMGSVYQADDLVLERRVAIKQLQIDPLASDYAAEQTREQFRREARILAALDHPNLPRVTDHFEEDGVEYLVMDYVAGKSLSEVLADHRSGLSESQVLEWADQLLSALEYIHQHGVIHRDIKPSNIRVTPDGRVFLVDFGLVKLYDPENPRTATIMHGLGTPEYAPPEQYDAHLGFTDPRSDIYALGATLYHLLTGQAPPTVTQQMSDPEVFQHPRAITPKVSRNVERVILRAMELNRARRFASASHMRSALLWAQKRNPDGTPTQRLPFGLDVRYRLSRRPVVLMALFGLLLVAGVATLTTTEASRQTPTATATLSPTATVEPTLAPLVIVTDTATSTHTPTATDTPTLTNTATSSPTPTPTATATATSTPTRRPVASPTPIPILGPTLTATPRPPGPPPPTRTLPPPTPVPTTPRPTITPRPSDTPEPPPTATRPIP